MKDSPPIGAGAGDTGDANALGQWLAGRDPNEVSHANQARREGSLIDPREWPGGVELAIPISAFGEVPDRIYLTMIFDEQGKFGTVTMLPNNDGNATATLEHAMLKKGSRFVISSSLPVGKHDQRGDQRRSWFEDEDGRKLVIFELPMRVPPSGLQTSDPLVVELRMDTIYMESP